MASERLDLHHLAADDVAREAARVAAAIRAGAVVVLPTETVYGLAALPDDDAGIARLRQLKGRAGDQPFTLHLADVATAAQHAAQPLHRSAQRLMRRYWPGPLTLVVPAHGVRGDVGLRLPAHDFTRAVIRACGGALLLTSVNRTGQAPAADPAAVASAFGDDIDLLVDGGATVLGNASTVVRVGPRCLELLREGILTRSEVEATAAALVLFVCTGNTCRSPMAAALLRTLVAEHLRCPPDELGACGLRVDSAGTFAGRGAPASPAAVQAAAEAGADLTEHASQPLAPELIERADRVFCMSLSHLQRVLELAPAAEPKTALLRPDDIDIADPYGAGLDAYRQARHEIVASLQVRLREVLALLD